MIYAIRIIHIEKILLIGTLLSTINAKLGQPCLLFKIKSFADRVSESDCYLFMFILKRKKIFRSREGRNIFILKNCTILTK